MPSDLAARLKLPPEGVGRLSSHLLLRSELSSSHFPPERVEIDVCTVCHMVGWSCVCWGRR
jgi:hypothetical protein